MVSLSRRRFIVLASGALASGLGVGAAGVLTFGARRAVAPDLPLALATEAAAATLAPSTSTPRPTPTPIPEPPVMPRGREQVRLMAGTEWEATGTIFHSGVAGPRFMVLGGVHGNEPGGWLGAGAAATWEVDRGMLIVLPLINHRSAAAFERTLEGIGDLNRLYPGDPEGVPMARMAHEITALAKQWRPHWLWDMHESWGFYNERGEDSGTAFIGQTVTSTNGEAGAAIEAVLGEVNGAISPREAFVTRSRPGGFFGGGGSLDTIPREFGGRGGSSLSLGNYVAGMKPVLVEMGQADQAEARRSELHQILVRAMMRHVGMFVSA